VYHFGAAAALRKYAKLPAETRGSGSSAGALAALCLLTDVPIGKER